MKKMNIALFAMSLLFALSLVLQGCDEYGTNQATSNRAENISAQATPINALQNNSNNSSDAKEAPSTGINITPACKDSLEPVLQEICSQFPNDAMQALRQAGKLKSTLERFQQLRNQQPTQKIAIPLNENQTREIVKQAVENAVNPIRDELKNKPPSRILDLSYVPALAISIGTLLGLIGLGWLGRKRFNSLEEKIDQFDVPTYNSTPVATTTGSSKDTQQLQKTLQNLNDQITGQSELAKQEFSKLQKRIDSFQNQQSVSPEPGTKPSRSSLDEVSSYERKLDFAPTPFMSVDDYKETYRTSLVAISFDSMCSRLVQKLEGNNEFLLIPQGQNLGFVIPSFGRLTAPELFATYYQGFYDLSGASTGDIWIRKPAVVQNTGDGWQLYKKGEMEIR